MDDRVARLTEGQREALRMVYRHMETKEIARKLGISPDGVTQRIKARDADARRQQAPRRRPHSRRSRRNPLPTRDRYTRHGTLPFAPDPATFAPSTEGERQAGLRARR